MTQQTVENIYLHVRGWQIVAALNTQNKSENRTEPHRCNASKLLQLALDEAFYKYQVYRFYIYNWTPHAGCGNLHSNDY